MPDDLNKLLGPSLYLLILDKLLESKGKWMNLREIARQVDKNPGSVSPVLPNLVERGLLQECKVGAVSKVYQLYWDKPEVQALLKLKKSLQED